MAEILLKVVYESVHEILVLTVHFLAAKAQMSVHKCAVSPELFLLAHRHVGV